LVFHSLLIDKGSTIIREKEETSTKSVKGRMEKLDKFRGRELVLLFKGGAMGGTKEGAGHRLVSMIEILSMQLGNNISTLKGCRLKVVIEKKKPDLPRKGRRGTLA